MANKFYGDEFAIANPAGDRANEGRVMPLILAPVGQEVKIVKIALDEKTKKHLLNLGVLAGGTITVLAASGGSTVCRVKEGRLALDRNIASHIYIA